ncbi:MAG TPA: ABC transporter ATP-binding protein [Woeseiaceae bacterium]|nr:ABC transporter ATP-binding protein [Woeseiaceae bacterium]
MTALEAEAQKTVLRVHDLTIGFPQTAGSPDVVKEANLTLQPGEIHGLVGESGSGKTLLARAVLGLLPPGAEIRCGSIEFCGRDVLGLDPAELRALRGPAIGMVFQEPMMSLNPALRVGRQMAEALHQHTDLGASEIRRRCIEMLERVRMPDPARCLAAYPHEFSGGMRQRIMLASVLLMRPTLLLADEPTTALDVLIQKEVLEIMTELVHDLGTAVLLITHDLGVVAKYARRVSVMHRGSIVEQGDLEETLMRPRHAYTRELLRALPHRADGAASHISDDSPLLVAVRDLRVTFSTRRPFRWRRGNIVRAVDGVSFGIRRNETLAVVGESGSGKTTLGRALLRLVDKSSGTITVDARDLDTLNRNESRSIRRSMQIVFQDPYSSLDPRQRLAAIVGEGLRFVPGLTRAARAARVRETLADVGIDPDWAERYPHELSGGQRQRIGIARAIITRPKVIVADEAVSALDLTVQAQILELLKTLQRHMGFSYLFISHDLGVVGQVADRIVVMYRGQAVESGRRDDILDRPHHPYTCALLNAVPELITVAPDSYRLAKRRAEVPAPPRGFAIDCRPHAAGGEQATELVEVSPGHHVAYRRSPTPGRAAKRLQTSTN